MITKRILKTFTSLISLIFIALLVWSCSDENDFHSSDLKLESLYSSSEYRELTNSISDFGEEIKTNYSLLSQENKDEVRELLYKMNNEANSSEEFSLLFNKLVLPVLV